MSVHAREGSRTDDNEQRWLLAASCVFERLEVTQRLGHDHQIIVAHNWGPRFTSRAEARAYQMLGADAINQSIGPEASAAREIGACFVSASYVVCYEDGIVIAPSAPIDPIHTDLAKVSTRISLLAIARAELSAECGCAALHIERPESYAAFAPRGGRD